MSPSAEAEAKAAAAAATAKPSPEKAPPITPTKSDVIGKAKLPVAEKPLKTVSAPVKADEPSTVTPPAKVEPKQSPKTTDVKKNDGAAAATVETKSVTVVTATTAGQPKTAVPPSTEVSSTSVANKSSPPTPKTPAKKEKPVAKPKPSGSATAKAETPIDDNKAKRNRLKTIPYQSPLPEIELISKLSASEANTTPKSADERLILFYRYVHT